MAGEWLNEVDPDGFLLPTDVVLEIADYRKAGQEILVEAARAGDERALKELGDRGLLA